jgi:uncharacterized protein (TIRG00374 family)
VLRRTDWRWVVVTSVLAPVGLWARAKRWHYFFPPGSAPPGLLAATMIGYMVNNVLPLRAGEVARVYVVARRWAGGFWTTLATLVAERILDGLTIVSLLAVLILLVPVPEYLRWGAAVMLAIDIAAAAMLATLAIAPAVAQRALDRIIRRWPALQRRAVVAVERFVRGLEGVRSPAHAAPLVAWTVIVWCTAALPAWTTLRAVGLELSWVAPWAVLAFVGVGIAVPSAPGFVGVYHGAAMLALGMFGVSRSEGFGYALLLHAAQFVPVTLTGWIFLVREQVRLAEATRAPRDDDPASVVPAG